MNWRLAAGWVLAVVATTAVAWQIVAVADERVGDAPVSPIEAAPPSTSEDTTTTTMSEPAISAGSESTTSTVDTTATSPTATTSGSEAQGDTTSTTASTASTTTSSTSSTSATAWATKTVVSNGGTVVVSYRPGEVRLETAVPLPGFQVEFDKSGPPEVDLEFESSSLRVRVKAEWHDGALEIDIDESSEGGDDD